MVVRAAVRHDSGAEPRGAMQAACHRIVEGRLDSGSAAGKRAAGPVG